jgi:hypothetical protein
MIYSPNAAARKHLPKFSGPFADDVTDGEHGLMFCLNGLTNPGVIGGLKFD